MLFHVGSMHVGSVHVGSVHVGSVQVGSALCLTAQAETLKETCVPLNHTQAEQCSLSSFLSFFHVALFLS
jgi:hypothetical protein